ncbi:MAG TPA: M61 family peptidase [Terriglobales bacterium]
MTDAPRNIFHEKMIIPAQPGPMTLVYPKWIPGNHRPSGPVWNLTGLKFQANGKDLDWQRDPVDMYAFHVNVPAGAQRVEVSMDTLTNSDSAGASGAAASSNVLDLNWNQVVLYPQGAASDEVQFQASVKLPAGWKFGTALPVAHSSGDEAEFSPVSLTTLVDSPLIAGSHYRKIDLTGKGEGPVHEIDMVSESEAGLNMSAADIASYRLLVDEAGKLFGARHYTEYHFLYTLSDEVAGHGLEHHQSSDNGSGERTLIDSELHMLDADLLPHEFVHSWNGKYRRPAGLATRNYQEPMVGDLLWVYEGLTDYLGPMLAARTGLWTAEQYREYLASTAAMLEHRVGRTWRPLEDTARSVQILRLAGPGWQNWRRGLDYYPEGGLIWLEVDTRIQQLTHGKKSLDDYCRAFYGGESGPPKVVPYKLEDILAALNAIAPYDWDGLFKERLNSRSPQAPFGGIEGGGWKRVYSDKPNVFVQAGEKEGKYINAFYSIGFMAKDDGSLVDVIPGSAAYEAGIGPGMKVLAVNGRRWSTDRLREALREAKGSSRAIDLLVENADFFKTYAVDYHGGEKYPHLERSEGEDLLSKIIAAHSK